MRKARMRVWSTLLAVAMLLTMLPTMAFASDDSSGGPVSLASDAPIGASATSWSYAGGVLTISGSGNVPGSDPMPWSGNVGEITKLVIGEGVTGTEGAKAFAGLNNLTEIEFPSTFTTVGHGAFANCSSLTTVTLPATVTALSSVAFSNCNNLESLYVLNRDIQIPTGAEWSTTKALPNNLTVYGYQYTDDTRNEPTALYQYIQAENEKLTAGTYTSGSAIKFFAYDVPYYATGTIGNTGITWKYTAATKVLTISGSGDVHFDRGEDGSGTPWNAYRSQIETVVFEEGITGVSSTKAFAEMQSLSEIVFPSTLTTLGAGIFASNQSLETVTLPVTLERMAGVVFSNCMNLKSLTIENPDLELPENSMWSSNAVPGCVAPDGLIVYGYHHKTGASTEPSEFYNYVKYNNEHGSNILFVALDDQTPIDGSNLNWSYDEDTKTLSITGEGMLNVASSALPWSEYKSSIETIVFGEGVTGSTATQTFAGMSSLQDIVFSSTFTDLIGTGTFSNNPSLEYVRLPETIEKLGSVVFSGTNNLKILRVDNPDLDVSASPWASDAMKRLPDNLTVYGYSADGTTDIHKFVKFQNDYSDYTNDITFIALDDPNTTTGIIGDSNTFWSYDGTTKTLTISGEGNVPGSQHHGVPWSAYQDEIETLVIEEGIKGTDGHKAFSDLHALTKIEFPASFISLGHGTFANCSSLKTVTLPETIQYISSVVFSNCNSLEKLRIENRNIDVSCVIDGVLDDGDEEDVVTTWSTTGTTPANLKVYGYQHVSQDGTGGNTEIYQYIHGNGITFIDLDRYSGVAGDVQWTFDNTTGTLTISGEGEIPDYATESPAPWSEFNGEIRSIVVEKGVTAIGTNAFSGITDLETAKINRTVSAIEGSAFSKTDAFTIEAKRGSAALEYANVNENVTAKELVTANILFIGNSYTEDAREYLRYVFDQYDFGADVNFGHLFSGGKTVAYYANCARSETNNSSEYGDGTYDTTSPRAQEDDSTSGTYRLTYLKSEGSSISFTSEGVRTIEYAMNDMDWDIVIIQGHDVEQMYGGEYADAFAVNLTYLTNYIKSFDPSVEIGYYMTWRRNQEDQSRLEAYWKTMQETVLGENSKVSFVIPVGTAVENARTTFLGGLNYIPEGDDPDTDLSATMDKVNLLTGEPIDGKTFPDRNLGLQRDVTHMSGVVGRFLAGYTIGAYLIDHINDMDGADFTEKEAITEIYSFDTAIGKLPAMYVDAIKASAAAAFAEPYAVTSLTDYTDPMNGIKTAVSGASYAFGSLTSEEALADSIVSTLDGLNLTSGANTTVNIQAMASGTFTARIAIQFGYRTDSVEVSGTYEVPSSSSSGSTAYTIAVPNSVIGGDVAVSPSRASSGRTVTITVSPDEGYELDELTVTDANGNEIRVTDKGNGKYTFTMPRSRVTIEATFVEIEEEPDVSTLPFTDVSEGDWFYDAVEYAYENGMMSGIGNDLFVPESNLNRAMMVQVLWNLEDTPAVSDTTDYSDVASGAWYYDAVQWATAENIVGGYGGGTYGPEDDITREQMALMLYRYAQYKGYDTTQNGADTQDFTDYADISDWALEGMTWAVNAGLLNGKGNGILDPTGNATRAEVAQILMNFCENIVE